jgi:hypothetical protein
VKTLNLDQLAKHTKTVTLGGKEYPVLDMTVEQFIETNAAAERLKDEKDPVKQLRETVALIKRAIPDCPIEQLNKLQFEQLGVLLDFINGDLEKEAAKANEGKGQAETETKAA